MAKYVICAAEELPPGARTVVEVAGRSIGVFNIGGDFFALRNSCPHQGGPLCLGQVSGFLMARVPGEYTYLRRGEFVRCPWHGWEFDIKSGQSWFDPQRMRVRSYPVTVENVTAEEPPTVNGAEDGLQKGPYVAESYPVTVEQRMLVVEIG
jgi:3-phenylpropionate/trans-cinnamate dioxygenase ferredoxin subunit